MVHKEDANMTTKTKAMQIKVSNCPGMTWGTKVEVTTTCPNCKKSFSRESYLESVIAGTALEMCPECVDANTDENGNHIIVLEKIWAVPSEGL